LDKILENDVSVREVRRRLENNRHIDPIDGRNIAEQLLALQQRRDIGLVTPIWPALYPNMKQRKCFHVMPFSLSWSNEIRDCVRSACETKDIQYVRGDETEEQRIILSIWQELSSATHIVVELGLESLSEAETTATHRGSNANVALELGIAHALGRRCLLVHNGKLSANSRFPEIEKLQIHAYSSPAELSRMVADFVQEEPS
jgi:hypothetical protein